MTTTFTGRQLVACSNNERWKRLPPPNQAARDVADDAQAAAQQISRDVIDQVNDAEHP